MRLLIELPLTIALFTLAVKYGWPYTLVFVLGYILAFIFKLPFLSKRTQVSTRFLIALGIYLTFALTLSTLIGRFFFSESSQGWIEGSRILTFLLVTPALKVLWATVIGFGLIAIVAVLILLPYGYLVAQNSYSQYEQYQGHQAEARRAAISNLMGLSLGTCVVNAGKVEFTKGEAGSLALFGGPGILVVQEGHAVILERSGRLSRVVGRGITFFEPFERLSMAVPLVARSERIVLENAATRDQIDIDEFEFWVFHRVDPGPEDEQVANGLTPYNPRILTELIWAQKGGDGRESVKPVCLAVARAMIGRYNVEDIYPISDQRRTELRRDLVVAINSIVRDRMGVQVVAADFGQIKIPEAARRKLMERWNIQRQTQIAVAENEIEVGRSEARAQSLINVENARAMAQRKMIGAISLGLGAAGAAAPNDVVALRLLEALEKMAEDPATKVLFPWGLDLGAQELRTALATDTPRNRTRFPISTPENGTGEQDASITSHQ